MELCRYIQAKDVDKERSIRAGRLHNEAYKLQHWLGCWTPRDLETERTIRCLPKGALRAIYRWIMWRYLPEPFCEDYELGKEEHALLQKYERYAACAEYLLRRWLAPWVCHLAFLPEEVARMVEMVNAYMGDYTRVRAPFPLTDAPFFLDVRNLEASER